MVLVRGFFLNGGPCLDGGAFDEDHPRTEIAVLKNH